MPDVLRIADETEARLPSVSLYRTARCPPERRGRAAPRRPDWLRPRGSRHFLARAGREGSRGGMRAPPQSSRRRRHRASSRSSNAVTIFFALGVPDSSGLVLPSLPISVRVGRRLGRLIGDRVLEHVPDIGTSRLAMSADACLRTSRVTVDLLRARGGEPKAGCLRVCDRLVGATVRGATRRWRNGRCASNSDD